MQHRMDRQALIETEIVPDRRIRIERGVEMEIQRRAGGVADIEDLFPERRYLAVRPR